jgi:hypothetical protein
MCLKVKGVCVYECVKNDECICILFYGLPFDVFNKDDEVCCIKEYFQVFGGVWFFSCYGYDGASRRILFETIFSVMFETIFIVMFETILIS